MKRRKFVAAVVAAIPVGINISQAQKPQRVSKGFKINAGEGRIHGHIQLKGVNVNILDVKVSGKDTNSDMAIFEQTGLSPGHGTPMHVHHSQDEIFFVTEGAYDFVVGGVRHKLSVGDSIFLPRKTPHSWVQISERGKMIVTLQPAGHLEEFFVTVSKLKSPPTEKEMAKIFEDNGMTVVGPPITVE